MIIQPELPVDFIIRNTDPDVNAYANVGRVLSTLPY